MSPTRQRVKLDEQAFQNLLAAAYTIQEHNIQCRDVGGTKVLAQELTRQLAAELTQQLTHQFCPQCGTPLAAGEENCGKCSGKKDSVGVAAVLTEEFRPGERMQQKWASMWQMTQHKGVWRKPPQNEKAETSPSIETARATVRMADVPPGIPSIEDVTSYASSLKEERLAEPQEALVPFESLTAPFELRSLEEGTNSESSAPPAIKNPRERDLHLTVRFQRADLYLVLAIVVAVIAMLWAVSTPSSAAAIQRNRGIQLSLWERALVSIGLANPPASPVYSGNPDVQVWVDPHTALYYCPGEEEFGKTPGGHYSSQRQAQRDQFEPSGRSACE
jgi:hypothetical protein